MPRGDLETPCSSCKEVIASIASRAILNPKQQQRVHLIYDAAKGLVAVAKVASHSKKAEGTVCLYVLWSVFLVGGSYT